jgi:mono/diheme cytochrome c family protein
MHLTGILVLTLAASSSWPLSAGTLERWYRPAHAEAGKSLFDSHCSGCHGAAAVGNPAWRQRDANGLLPPPPLNGSAHAWHHPLTVLYRQIAEGSAPGVGNMPAFRGNLSRGEILAIIAYFQSLWPDDIYVAWQRIDAASKRGELKP